MKKRGMGKSEQAPIINTEADSLKKYLESNPVMDPVQALANFATNVVSQVVFAQRWEYGDPEYAAFIDAVHRNLGYVAPLSNIDLFPWLQLLPSSRILLEENEKAREHLSSHFRKVIMAAMQSYIHV